MYTHYSAFWLTKDISSRLVEIIQNTLHRHSPKQSDTKQKRADLDIIMYWYSAGMLSILLISKAGSHMQKPNGNQKRHNHWYTFKKNIIVSTHHNRKYWTHILASRRPTSGNPGPAGCRHLGCCPPPPEVTSCSSPRTSGCSCRTRPWWCRWCGGCGWRWWRRGCLE